MFRLSDRDADTPHRRRLPLTIVSGGQTGADRAALDFALQHGIPHGGWCPLGRLAEDGVIPGQYLLRETPTSDYAQRTEWNVRDSDGTVVFSLAVHLTGGSRTTMHCVDRLGKPGLHLRRHAHVSLTVRLRRFLQDNQIRVLNVAGPRASEEPDIGHSSGMYSPARCFLSRI